MTLSVHAYLCCQDNQVPVCPLCNCPVPLGATGALPDEVVGRHIDNDCQSETAQSRRKVCGFYQFFSEHPLLCPHHRWALIDAAIRLSVCLSVCRSYLGQLGTQHHGQATRAVRTADLSAHGRKSANRTDVNPPRFAGAYRLAAL